MDIRKEIDKWSEEESFIKDYLKTLFDIYSNIKEFYETDLASKTEEVTAIMQSDKLKLDIYRDLYQLYKDAE